MTSLCPRVDGASMKDRVNIAPMGPIVDEPITRLILRPFQTSTTYRNLKATGQGVFHITDDALLMARAAIGRVRPGPALTVRPAERVEGLVLTGACQYYEIQVEKLEDREARTRVEARVVGGGTLRDFFGFNRARHAVLEAAILATRVHLTGAGSVLNEYNRLNVMVEKTGSRCEHEAMQELRTFVETYARSGRRPMTNFENSK